MQLATTNGGGLMTADRAAAVRGALKSSLYPGASDASVDMVLAYCRAAELDPMTKPVHIVPISVKSGKKKDDGTDIYENRDVVMPGIGLYRIRAASTGAFVGVSDPEFGPTRTLDYRKKVTEWANGRRSDKWVDSRIEYPEWCKVSVYRLVGGQRCEFSAIEYWVENYATAGRNSDAPNEMWAKRPRGQLNKCAEAQALRKAFPEFGSAPTAEEMEGSELELPATPAATQMPQRKALAQTEPVEDAEIVDEETGEVTNEAKPEPQAEAKAAGGELSAMPAGMRRSIEAKLTAAGLDVAALAAAHPGIGTDAATAGPDANKAFAWIKAQQS